MTINLVNDGTPIFSIKAMKHALTDKIPLWRKNTCYLSVPFDIENMYQTGIAIGGGNFSLANNRIIFNHQHFEPNNFTTYTRFRAYNYASDSFQKQIQKHRTAVTKKQKRGYTFAVLCPDKLRGCLCILILQAKFKPENDYFSNHNTI